MTGDREIDSLKTLVELGRIALAGDLHTLSDRAAEERFARAADTGFIDALDEIMKAAVERRRSEDSLRSSEQRMQMAQRIAGLGSYDWEIDTDINRWSDELYRIYGTEPQSFNASYERFMSFIHPDDRERVSAIHRKAFDDHEPYQMEERIVRPDGSERILLSNGEVICDDAGRPIRMVGICMDVTDGRNAESDREAERRKAEEHEIALAAMRLKRRQALEINDNVVQGIAAVIYSLENKDETAALDAARQTLASAREMMTDLLSGDTEVPFAAGDLVRESAAAAVLPRRTRGKIRAARSPSTVRAIVADDSSDMRMLVRVSLEATGAASVVGEAADGLQAITLASKLQPDLIVLDLSMPKMDGLQAIPELRRACPATKIVVLSGFDEMMMSGPALAAGADAYVEKGGGLSELASVVSSLVTGQTPAHT